MKNVKCDRENLFPLLSQIDRNACANGPLTLTENEVLFRPGEVCLRYLKLAADVAQV